MTRKPSKPTERYETDSKFQASQEIRTQFGDHLMQAADTDNFQCRENCVDLDQLSIVTLEFVGDISILHYTTRGHFLFHIPLCGHFLCQSSDGEKRIEPPQAFMLAPGITPHFLMSAGTKVLILKVSSEALEQHAQHLLQYKPKHSLAFPLTNFSSRGIKHLLDTAHLILNQFEEMPNDSLKKLWQQQAEQLLLSGLLLKLESNYQALLRRSGSQGLPPMLREAHNYMLANIDQPISLDDLSEATGLSERSLSYQFKKHTDSTVMNYLLALRLDELRDALRAAEPNSSVTDIASRFGINHPGRLAQYYRLRFAELPSTTLKQAGQIRKGPS